MSAAASAVPHPDQQRCEQLANSRPTTLPLRITDQLLGKDGRLFTGLARRDFQRENNLVRTRLLVFFRAILIRI